MFGDIYVDDVYVDGFYVDDVFFILTLQHI